MINETLLAGIRSGEYARYHLLLFTRGNGVVRCWDGIGDLYMDGHTWSGRAGLIEADGFGQSAELQSEEITLTLSHLVSETLGDADLDIRGLKVQITAFFMNGRGETLPDRLSIYKGVARTSNIHVGRNEATAQIAFVPELLDTRRTRLTRYSVEDQAGRFPTDTGFSNVAGLVNAQPVAWAISSTGGGSDTINVQWTESGGVVTLTDTANRAIHYDGIYQFKSYTCDGNTVLLLNDPFRLLSKELTWNSTEESEETGYSPGTGSYHLCKIWHRTMLTNGWRYNQLGHSQLHDNVTGIYRIVNCSGGAQGTNHLAYNSKSTALAEFTPVELHADGFVYVAGSRVTVDDVRNVVDANLVPINLITIDIPEYLSYWGSAGWFHSSAQQTPVCSHQTFTDGNSNGLNVMFAESNTTALKSDVI